MLTNGAYDSEFETKQSDSGLKTWVAKGKTKILSIKNKGCLKDFQTWK